MVAFLQLQPLLCARDGAQSRDWAVAESGSAFGPSWDPSLLVQCSRMGRRERSRAGRALLGPELGLSPLPGQEGQLRPP